MATTDAEITQCQFCKEEIRAGARLCRHCGARFGPRLPEHGGLCPYCKEEIHVEAIRCKHCRSDLTIEDMGSGRGGDCGGGCGGGCSGGRSGGPYGLRQSRGASAYSLQRGGYPDPECFHDCYWRCVDATGDAQWCWVGCALVCPEATLAPRRAR